MAQNETPPFDAKAFAAKYGGVTTTKYQANSIVFAQGDAADCVFYIQQGKVKLSVVSEQGKEAVIAVLETGDLCGEGCLAVSIVVITTTWAFAISARTAYSRVGHTFSESPHIMKGVDDQTVSPLTLRVTSQKHLRRVLGFSLIPMLNIAFLRLKVKLKR